MGAGWRVLSDGGGDSVVLAVDYWVGRSQAGFRELVGALGMAITVLETVPPTDAPLDPRRYRDAWLAGIDDHTRVELVLGNCVGAGYALALAAAIGELPGRTAPPVVLFNPELASAETIGAEFERLTANLGGGAVVDPSPGANLPALATRLAEVYRSLLVRRAEEVDELDDEFVDELTAFAAGYLRYLAAAGDLDLGKLPRAAVALTAATACSGLELAARTVRFDVDRAALLTHPEVVQAVSDMIGVTR